MKYVTHFLKPSDLSSKEWKHVLALTQKAKAKPEAYVDALSGKSLAMLFQKTSTRTRTSFEVAMTQLGGHALYLNYKDTNFEQGALKDEITCIGKYCDAIMARVYWHADLDVMVSHAGVPVINGLSNLWHPCQAVGDLFTLQEYWGTLKGKTLAYVGDGNNVCNSLISACAKLGVSIHVATPTEYKPFKNALEEGQAAGVLTLFEKPASAIKDADALYTDTWVSLGEEEISSMKIAMFRQAQFQVNTQLLEKSNTNGIPIMHCLPAHRDVEIEGALLDSSQSIVFEQAENRMHAQKALLLHLLKGGIV